MKIFLFLFLLLVWNVFAWAQAIPVEVEAEHYKIEDQHLPANSGSAFIAVQGQPIITGLTYTPGGQSWEYRWNLDGGAWNYDGDYGQDSVNFNFRIDRAGLYTVSAFKGETEETVTFRVFFAEVPEFSAVISDKEACDFIKVGMVGYTPADYQGFNGNGTPVYSILKDGKERILAAGSNPALAPIAEVPTFEDADYEIKVKDRFGFEWLSTTAHYESVIPKAVATIKLGNKVDVVGEVNAEMGQAPLEVEFNTDECVNAGQYEWLLYRDTSTMVGIGTNILDSLLDERIRTEDHFVYTYENTGQYKVLLIAVNENGNRCADTSEVKYINVVASLVNVPNVFTPNGDGKNDIFQAQALSVESFHGVILNRWGRKVYEWSDPAGGWDGRIGGKYASPGTYYYIITARGREKNNPPQYIKKGPLLLVR